MAAATRQPHLGLPGPGATITSAQEPGLGPAVTIVMKIKYMGSERKVAIDQLAAENRVMGGNTVIGGSKVIENTFTPKLSRVFPAPVSTIAEEMAETSGLGLTLARYYELRQRNGSLMLVGEGGGGQITVILQTTGLLQTLAWLQRALQRVF